MVLTINMMEIILIFLFFSLFFHSTKSEKSFVASFQSSGQWSENEWIEYKDKIPVLFELTACHWEKIEYFSTQINTVWTYCMYITKMDTKMRCMEVYYKILPDHGFEIDFTAWLDGWTDETLYIEFKRIPYQHRTWNHFCWTYSSKTGENNLYHNGQWVGEVNLLDHYGTTGPSIQASDSLDDFAFIIGQEPDSMRGDYQESQGFPGEVTELNVWDMLLKENDIFRMANCTDVYRGNAVMWKKDKLKTNLAKITDIIEASMFCKKKVVYATFPQQVSLKYGRSLCSRFGGKMSVPRSKMENDEIKRILNQHERGCIKDKNHRSKEKVKGFWLGFKKSYGNWYNDANLDDSVSPIVYSNWYGTYNLSDNVDDHCPYMFADGTWGYGRRKICESLNLCLICSFNYIPVYTLKGQCEKSTSRERYYYMLTDSSNQVELFMGLTKNSNISLQGGLWIKVGNNNFEKMEFNNSNYPLGRYNWNWFDTTCGVKYLEKRKFTFSVCKFGTEYSCDSGKCIKMEKRCDAVYDCEDKSDEDECNHVSFPGAYDRLSAPFISKGKNQTLDIATKITIEKIDFIDTLKMKIGLTLTVQMKWKDRRLGYTNLHPYDTYSLSNKIHEKLWLPLDHVLHKHAVVGKVFSGGNKKVTVKGSKNDLHMSLYQPREDFHFAATNISLMISQTLRIEYNCLFELQKYPFDNLFCDLGLKLDGKAYETFFIVGDPNTSIEYKDSPNIEDFKIVGIENNLDVPFGNGTFRANLDEGLIFTILIKRSYVDQMISIFCPSILFWLLAYCTMFLDIDDVSNRSRTSVTVLLVLIALLQTVKEEFPKTTYYKYIDIWFLWYTFNIFVITLYQILVPVIQVNIANMRHSRIKQTPILPFYENDESHEKSYKVNGDLAQNETILMINKILIFIFPITLIIFNVIYFFVSL